MDVYLFSLVLAKGGCTVLYYRPLATFYLRKPFLAVYLLDLLTPPLYIWHAQAQAEWPVYRHNFYKMPGTFSWLPQERIARK
jgi:hypothetical protein